MARGGSEEAADRVSLPMLLERYPGRRGTRNLRALLESPEPIGFTRNDFEEAFLALVDTCWRDAGRG